MNAATKWFGRTVVVGIVVSLAFALAAIFAPDQLTISLGTEQVLFAYLWLANIGLAGMVTGFVLAPRIGPRSAPVTATGGVLFAAGAFAFVINMWRTFNAADARARARAMQQVERILPTAE